LSLVVVVFDNPDDVFRPWIGILLELDDELDRLSGLIVSGFERTLGKLVGLDQHVQWRRLGSMEDIAKIVQSFITEICIELLC
jgi:hypothetical protein